MFSTYHFLFVFFDQMELIQLENLHRSEYHLKFLQQSRVAAKIPKLTENYYMLDMKNLQRYTKTETSWDVQLGD